MRLPLKHAACKLSPQVSSAKSTSNPNLGNKSRSSTFFNLLTQHFVCEWGRGDLGTDGRLAQHADCELGPRYRQMDRSTVLRSPASTLISNMFPDKHLLRRFIRRCRWAGMLPCLAIYNDYHARYERTHMRFVTRGPRTDYEHSGIEHVNKIYLVRGSHTWRADPHLSSDDCSQIFMLVSGIPRGRNWWWSRGAALNFKCWLAADTLHFRCTYPSRRLLLFTFRRPRMFRARFSRRLTTNL